MKCPKCKERLIFIEYIDIETDSDGGEEKWGEKWHCPNCKVVYEWEGKEMKEVSNK